MARTGSSDGDSGPGEPQMGFAGLVVNWARRGQVAAYGWVRRRGRVKWRLLIDRSDVAAASGHVRRRGKLSGGARKRETRVRS